jgi:hypothetical protein
VNVYVMRIEVKGLKGNRGLKSGKHAFVNCIVPGTDRDDGLQIMEKALKEDKLELLNVSKIENFYDLEFKAKDRKYIEMAKDAIRYQSVYYSEFNTWDE